MSKSIEQAKKFFAKWSVENQYEFNDFPLYEAMEAYAKSKNDELVEFVKKVSMI